MLPELPQARPIKMFGSINLCLYSYHSQDFFRGKNCCGRLYWQLLFHILHSSRHCRIQRTTPSKSL